MARWLDRFRESWTRARRDEDLERELRSHLEAEIEDQLEAGLPPEEARYAARRALGNVALIKEDTRAVWRSAALDGLVQDLGYAVRTLRKSPAFTVVAVLSLGLGIGANTAIFTFVNAALLRPLPYPQADRIVALLQRPLDGNGRGLMLDGKGTTLVHPVSFVEWRDRARSFEALTIAQPLPVNTDGSDGAEMVAGLWSTADLFRVFGVAPALGRAFTDEESRPGVERVAVLSHEYWRRRFGSDPEILGSAIRLGGGRATVVGVMPAGFRVGTLSVDVYYPLPLDRGRPETVGSRSFLCYGRLGPGTSLQAAQAEMALVAERVGQEHPGEKGLGVLLLALRDSLVRDSRRGLLLLLGVVVFVLLIACANLAGLLLTRGVGRRSELALRAALGARRSRLVQQLVVESLVLALLGGALGLLLGFWASRGLVFLAQDAVSFGQMADVRLDAGVLAFTVGLSLLTAIAFGLAPAWQVSRFDLQGALAERGRGGSDGRSQQRLRATLVTAEVALTVVLLAGAGLLLRTFSHLLQVKLGFEPEHVLTMKLFLTDDAIRRASLVESILDRIETVPDVQAVGTIQFLPFGGWTNQGPFRFVGRPAPRDPMSMESEVSTVSRGYIAAMGIPLVSGRDFDRRDRMGGQRVALVNQAFVDRYCPREDPLGQVIIGDWANPAPTQIVGVVGDMRHNGLTADPRPTVFLAQAQVPGYITYVVVRTSRDVQGIAATVRQAIRQVDRNQAAGAVQPMRQYVATALARPRLYAVLLGAFASLALALSAVGLYGLMAYAVSRRTREIGIRMALGAQPADILRSIVGQGARLAVMGLAIGTLCAMALSRFVASLLHGVGPGDPISYAGSAAVLGVATLIAALIPARRASRVDPMVALRYE